MKATKLLPLLIIFLIILSSCNNKNSQKSNNKDTIQHSNVIDNQKVLNINAEIKILNSKQLKCGDFLTIEFSIIDSTKIDSIIIFSNNKKILDTSALNFSFDINTKNFKTGTNQISATIYKSNSYKQIKKQYILFSDIKPVEKTYKVIKEYPHDENAYTQGLCYEDGILYEATGLETKSTLRKEKLETAEVIYSITIPNNVFGEGITLFNNEIVQITWRDHVGYVYNKDDFQIISEFHYNTEGWGLTTDGEKLFMSDGTNNIYILDPATFSVIDKIQVYDNKVKINLLNELEYINGIIYANVYTKDFIVGIDPKTGKVLEHIDMNGILPDALRDRKTDVLNGIAYDKINDRISVTGKNWKKLYEVKFINK